MKKLSVALAASALLCLSACAWFKANEATVTTDLSKDALCVVAQVATSNVDPVSIGIQCGGLAIEQIAAIVEAEIAKLAPVDAGVGAGLLPMGALSLLSKLYAVQAQIAAHH